MYDDTSRISDLAHFFQAQGRQSALRANDPETFVRLAYIAKSALDRRLGAGNPHSAALVLLCDSVEDAAAPVPSDGLAERYRKAAQVLRSVAFENIHFVTPSNDDHGGFFR